MEILYVIIMTLGALTAPLWLGTLVFWLIVGFMKLVISIVGNDFNELAET